MINETNMKNYLTTLIEEKGTSVKNEIAIQGHFGLTWEMLIDYIESTDSKTKAQIKTTLVKIDFLNGDIFHFLSYCANGMIKSLGY